MVWGQRTCTYPGEYAPELLEAMSEYCDDDNPDVIDTAFKEYTNSGDFSSVRIIDAEISDEFLVRSLDIPHTELSNLAVF